MAQATIHVVTIPKRMLTKAEAAEHCGRPLKQFLAECPVSPVKFQNGDIRYDVRDLDEWLDALKVSNGHFGIDDIIERLAE